MFFWDKFKIENVEDRDHQWQLEKLEPASSDAADTFQLVLKKYLIPNISAQSPGDNVSSPQWEKPTVSDLDQAAVCGVFAVFAACGVRTGGMLISREVQETKTDVLLIEPRGFGEFMPLWTLMFAFKNKK